MKTCSKCCIRKSLSDFVRDKYKKSNLTSQCKKCRALSSRIWKTRNPTKVKGTRHKWAAVNKEKLKDCNRKSYHKYKLKRQDRDRFRRFGISKEIFFAMLKNQNNNCAICGNPERGLNKYGEIRSLCTDHDHHTGKVRGLLCLLCNSAIGKLKDSPELLRKAALYIEQCR